VDQVPSTNVDAAARRSTEALEPSVALPRALPIALFGLVSCIALAESAPTGVTHSGRLLYTWKLNALTFGEDVSIYADGTFKSRKWCDICQPRLVGGTWTEDATGVTLWPSNGTQRPRHLVLVVRGPCHFLSDSGVRGDNEAIFSFSVYFRDDEHCEISSDGVARKL